MSPTGQVYRKLHLSLSEYICHITPLKKERENLKSTGKKDNFQRSNNKIDSRHFSRNSGSQKILGDFFKF